MDYKFLGTILSIRKSQYDAEKQILVKKILKMLIKTIRGTNWLAKKAHGNTKITETEKNILILLKKCQMEVKLDLMQNLRRLEIKHLMQKYWLKRLIIKQRSQKFKIKYQMLLFL